jgi:maltooligosyltrehalose trehalohydrolase
MHRFQVWAPKVHGIEVELKGEFFPMKPQKDGWWSVDIEPAGPGTDYSFRVDGNGPSVADPRSPWQPHGVHGPSRILDHSAFPWADREWQAPPLSSAIIYELHIGTFTPEGTFDAAVHKLDYLRDLGVTHVELMPVASFPGTRGWGYDGVDLFAPQESYGGPDGLKRLVNACHQKGLAVLLDVVYNHLGPDGNYLGNFGPYFTSSHSTPWGEAMNLEGAGSYEVRRFFCDNAIMWLRDYHFDGLRLDAVHAYIDRSAIHFLEQLAAEIDDLKAHLGRHLVLIAESDLNDSRIVRPREAHGYGMDAQWSDDFHHALFTVLTGEKEGYYVDFGDIADLVEALQSAFVYDGRYSKFRGRQHGHFVESLPAWRFLGYSQNHDQVGNRARGERLVHLASLGRARIAAALVLTAPFVPMLFQGEEFAASTPFLYFTDHQDEELGRLVSEGRRKEFAAFGWKPQEIPDPQAEETFLQSKLSWGESTEGIHADMLSWYRALIHLRRSFPELTSGRLHQGNVLYDEEERWLVTKRGTIWIACNLGEEDLTIQLPSETQLLLSSEKTVKLMNDELTVPRDTVGIIRMA